MSRDSPAFSEAELRTMVDGLSRYIDALKQTLRDETEPITLRAALLELKLARRGRRKILNLLGDVGPTPHADALLRKLGIKG